MATLKIPGLLVLLAAAVPAAAEDASIPAGDSNACMQGPLAQFGRYIGDWIITDERLSQDGSEWVAGGGARWNFVCIGNGTAVQDFWLPPDGNVGTNLRTYNTETGAWDIAWAITTQPGFAHIEAQHQDDDTIVMHYVSPLPDPLRRITFFPPDSGGWDWQLEMSWDQGENWTEVYRIRASRAK